MGRYLIAALIKYRTLLEEGNAEQRRKLIESTDWSAVSSNVEKLPYYAYMLQEHTPRSKPKPAEDSELFTFAVDTDWKDELDQDVLSKIDSLLRDYNACLSRIRACKAPIKSRRREMIYAVSCTHEGRRTNLMWMSFTPRFP